jgi:2-polyprenyl-6-methoxyphenol hydroxylase-like FAD-dependent oxidoreductase
MPEGYGPARSPPVVIVGAGACGMAAALAAARRGAPVILLDKGDELAGGPLEPPFYTIRVRGALFHTQGGLKVDQRVRVLRPDGTSILGLYATWAAERRSGSAEAATKDTPAATGCSPRPGSARSLARPLPKNPAAHALHRSCGSGPSLGATCLRT